MQECPKCSSRYGDDIKLCPTCGANLGAVEEEPPEASWKCPHCGELVPGGFEVCWNCGTSQDGVADPSFSKEPESDQVSGYLCGTCGKYHPAAPMDVGMRYPDPYFAIPSEERESRCYVTPDVCVIDGKEFYIRACLEIPVVDGPGPFVWGVWVSLSEKNYKRYVELWDYDGKEKEPPYFGWLCSSIANYPETMSLKTNVYLRPANKRPSIELQPTDHPLAVEQRDGITMVRVREIVAAFLHQGEK